MWNKVGLKGGKHGDQLPGRKPSSKLQPESGICWLALRLGATGCKWGDGKQGCLLGSPFSLHTARMISSKLASCHLLQFLQNSLCGFSFFFLILTKQTIIDVAAVTKAWVFSLLPLLLASLSTSHRSRSFRVSQVCSDPP